MVTVVMSVTTSVRSVSIEMQVQATRSRSRNSELCAMVFASEETVAAPSVHPKFVFCSILGTIFGMGMVFAGFASWPMKDPIAHPENWWECMLQCATIWTCVTAVYVTSIAYSILLGDFGLLPIKAFLIVCALGSTSVLLLWCGYYAVWVLALGLPYPGPWHGAIAGIGSLASMSCSVWITFPRAWRQDAAFRRKMPWMLAHFFAVVCVILVYWGVMVVFAIARDAFPEYQWLLTFAIPLVKEGGVHAVLAIGRRAAGRSDKMTDLVLQHLVVCNHTLFISVCMTSVASATSMYLLLGLDSAGNILLGVKVWRLHGAEGEKKRAACVEALMGMLLSEISELILPLAYLACFLVAYQGPNAEVLGNVRANRWQYSAVTDLDAAIEGTLLMITLDAVSLVMTSIALKCLCGINMWQIFLYMSKELAVPMVVQQVWVMQTQFCVIAIGCAMDATFKFDWL